MSASDLIPFLERRNRPDGDTFLSGIQVNISKDFAQLRLFCLTSIEEYISCNIEGEISSRIESIEV